MKFFALFIYRPVATILLSVAITLCGILGFRMLPVAPLPQVDFPVIMVSASLPGASPETMASSVATPLERSLGRIAGVSEMTSSSSLGSTRIILQFDFDRDINGAARDVQAAINAAQSLLPSGMPSRPTYRKANPSDAPIMILTLTSDTYSQGELYDFASTQLAPTISQIDGVGDVDVGGSSLPAVRVGLNPQALFNQGVSLDDVRTAVSNANVRKPQGALEDGTHRWQIQTNDELKTAAEYQPLIIHYNNGGAVRLGDVATVTDSVQDVRNAGMTNAKPAILLMIRKLPEANIIQTVDSIRAKLPELQETIPAAIDLQIAQDRSPTIRASLEEVEQTLIISVALVILVVFLFLRSGRATIIPAVSVPVSLIGTFAAMYLCGFSLNNLSLMALTIATGFVVDDAIVVLENIARHLEAGMKTVASRTARYSRSRFYGAVDESVTGGGVPAAAVDGRIAGPTVTRICRDAFCRHWYIVAGFSDINANDVWLDAESQQAARAKATAWFWSHVGSPATRLRQVTEMGAQSYPSGGRGAAWHHCAEYLAVYLDPENLLPGAGHWRVDGRDSGGSEYFVSGDAR